MDVEKDSKKLEKQQKKRAKTLEKEPVLNIAITEKFTLPSGIELAFLFYTLRFKDQRIGWGKLAVEKR